MIIPMSFDPVLTTFEKSKDEQYLLDMISNECQLIDNELKEMNPDIDISLEAINISGSINKIIAIIKKLIQKAIAFILRLCKWIMDKISDAIKWCINTIKPLFRDKSTNNEFVITISDGINIRDYKITSLELGYEHFKKSLTIILKRIENCKNTSRYYLNEIENELKHLSLDNEKNYTLEQVLIYYDSLKIHAPDTDKIVAFQGSSIIDNMLLEHIQSFDLTRLDEIQNEIRSSHLSINNTLRYLIRESAYQFDRFTQYRIPNYIDMTDNKYLGDVIKNKYLTMFLGEFEAAGRNNPNNIKIIEDNVFFANFGFQIPKEYVTRDQKFKFIDDNITMIKDKYHAIVEQFSNAVKLNFTSLYIGYWNAYIHKSLDELDSRKIITTDKKLRLNNPSQDDYMRFNSLIKANLDTFSHYNGELIDFGELGLGTIIVAKSVLEKDKFLDIITDFNYSSKFLPYVINFDISIVTHGKGEQMEFFKYYKGLWDTRNRTYDYYCFKDIYAREIMYLEQELKKPLYRATGNEMVRLRLDKFGTENSFIIKSNGSYKPIKNKRIRMKFGSVINVRLKDIHFVRWIIKPIYTPSRQKFNDMECLVYKLLLDGYHNINCLVCNPTGVIFTHPKFQSKDNKICIAINDLNT